MPIQPEPSRPIRAARPCRGAAWALAAAVALAPLPLAADGPALPEAGGLWQAVPWREPGLAGPDGSETSRAEAARARRDPRLELAVESAPEGLRPRGLLFRAALGFRLGALGGIDQDGRGFRAMVALRLDF